MALLNEHMVNVAVDVLNTGMAETVDICDSICNRVNDAGFCGADRLDSRTNTVVYENVRNAGKAVDTAVDLAVVILSGSAYCRRANEHILAAYCRCKLRLALDVVDSRLTLDVTV